MKFNTKTQVQGKTINMEGGEAFKQTDKLELVSIMLTSFIKKQYYGTPNETLTRLAELIARIPDKEFVAKTALYARKEFGMRSITHVAAGELAKHTSGAKWTKDFYRAVIKRADDITEIVSYYMAVSGHPDKISPMPNTMKKGIAEALVGFNEYRLAKYRREKSSVSLVDIVNLVHPKHTDAIKALVDGTLKSTDTWETRLTQAGQKAKNDEEKAVLKAQVWKELIDEKIIGYFALLRNMRNILQQAPLAVDKAIDMLTDETLISKSLILPFRFLTAVQEIEKIDVDNSRKVISALSKAIDIATKNVPVFPGKTLVAVDGSGSMYGPPIHIASTFAAVLAKANDADVLIFDNRIVEHNYNPDDSTLSLANTIKGKANGGGTDFNLVFSGANKKYDRIIILSDMQAWVKNRWGSNVPTKAFKAYKQRFDADPAIFSFDLTGHGSMQFPERNVCTLAGFSDKIFDVMKFVEEDKHALIHTIEKVKFSDYF